MIVGREFDAETIHKEEKASLNDFYAGNDPILSDSIAYYSILFEQFLYRNADKKFIRYDKNTKKQIIDKEMAEFEAAMRYSFNKGHQTAFLVLLMSTKNNQSYDVDYFERPDSLNNFLYTLDQSISPDVVANNISRDANDTLINYTRKNFENGYNEVMTLGRIFFKKGASVAFDQIRKNIVGVDYKISRYSRMLSVPYNQEFTVTPAFKGQFSIETPGFEEWDVFWDATYDAKFANNLIAKVLIHNFVAKNIREYSEVGAPTYQMLMNRHLIDKFDDNESLYVVEINFVLFDPRKTVRLLEQAEYQATRVSLASTISRKLNVDDKHIFITD